MRLLVTLLGDKGKMSGLLTTFPGLFDPLDFAEELSTRNVSGARFFMFHSSSTIMIGRLQVFGKLLSTGNPSPVARQLLRFLSEHSKVTDDTMQTMLTGVRLRSILVQFGMISCLDAGPALSKSGCLSDIIIGAARSDDATVCETLQKYMTAQAGEAWGNVRMAT